jgi:nucleotide-binding universal stress UspA family protein
LLFLVLFGRRARVVDAAAEAQDPRLIRLRGRNPLVLAPLANPANVATMVELAGALAPPVVGRVLLLSVVTPPESTRAEEIPEYLRDTQTLLGNALRASFTSGTYPETLTTISTRPWPEILRVAQSYHCESLLLGFNTLADRAVAGRLEKLVSAAPCDVTVLRAPPGWELSRVRRILVPVAGRGGHDDLRARLLGSLYRTGRRETTLLRIVPTGTDVESREKARRDLDRLAADEVPGPCERELVESDDVAREVAARAAAHDLVVLGLQRLGPRRKAFGDLALGIARTTDCGIIMISRRG